MVLKNNECIWYNKEEIDRLSIVKEVKFNRLNNRYKIKNNQNTVPYTFSLKFKLI